jgi:methanogenic corrinoid protein MtbC1
MSSNGKFVAQILETSAAGYAGLSANLLAERDPQIVKRYEPEGFSNWKAQLQRWLLDLSAALHAGEPKLFEARMRWTKSEFIARQVPLTDLQAALTALRDTLRDRLPAGSSDLAVQPIDRALEAVTNPRPDDVATAPACRPALAYMKTILEGQPREAIAQVLAVAGDETSARRAYLDVLIPAQRETGRLWHAGALSIAEEHVITATTQRVMALLCERGRSSSPNGKTVLLACVAGNVHDIGIRAISDFHEMAGWRVINLGPDTPDGEIAASVALFDADVVVLAAALDPHLKAVQRVIERIRALEDRDLKVIVGGGVFDRVPDLWKKIGADGHAAQVEDAEPLSSRLTLSQE